MPDNTLTQSPAAATAATSAKRAATSSPAACPTVKATPATGPVAARQCWQTVGMALQSEQPLQVDMSDIRSLDRPAIAALIRFLQDADQSRAPITLVRTPPNTRAHLELLGIHHLVNFG